VTRKTQLWWNMLRIAQNMRLKSSQKKWCINKLHVCMYAVWLYLLACQSMHVDTISVLILLACIMYATVSKPLSLFTVFWICTVKKHNSYAALSWGSPCIHHKNKTLLVWMHPCCTNIVLRFLHNSHVIVLQFSLSISMVSCTFSLKNHENSTKYKLHSVVLKSHAYEAYTICVHLYVSKMYAFCTQINFALACICKFHIKIFMWVASL